MLRKTKSLGFILSLSAFAVSADPTNDTFRDPVSEVTFPGSFLFGLSTAPNGDLLVAATNVGIIAVRRGEIAKTIVLPTVTDMHSIGAHTLWATTSNTPADQDAGQGLHLISPAGSRKVANFHEFEAAYNPDGGLGPRESNPFDVQSLGGFGAVVADAAANDLLIVDGHGTIRVLAIFPPEVVSTANIKALAGCPSASGFCSLPDTLSAEAVPTSIAVGRDGHFYVGELKGFPGPTGESNIWRVSPRAHWAQCGSSPECVKVFDGGFTSIIDLAFGPDGKLYVAEMDEGSFVAPTVFGTPAGGTVNACDIKTRRCHEVAGDIDVLTGITFDKGGSLWVTRHDPNVGVLEKVADRFRH